VNGEKTPTTASPRILIGTSGYSYQDWVGPFYPPGTDKRDFLAYYASRYPFTELNFSYYRQPSAHTSAGMVARTPEGFQFSVKMHQSVTHERTDSWKREVHAFAEGVEPFRANGRLAGVLLQFPFSFHYRPENRHYLAHVCDELACLPLFVEFRNVEWQKRQVYEGLAQRGVGLVVVDAPDLKGLPEPEVLATAEAAYLRFHGRNRGSWWTGDNATRYDYRYTADELADWVEPVRLLAEKTRLLLVAFNNHPNANAAFNADELRLMLVEQGILR
jgi:uncharacterized protein YecE (DUF72 family)